jgi:hypothetical protein
MKTLAKSLHTVSVLVNVARRERYVGRMLLQQNVDALAAVNRALFVLGYDVIESDTYGLVARAVAILEKDGAP